MGAVRYRNLKIRGVVYPTATDAAKALGVSADAVRIAARKGTLHRVGTGRVGVEPMPVRIRGLDFPNAKAAAVHFGVTVHAVHYAISAGDPDRIGRRSKPPQARARPITLYGVNFPSHAEASRQLGFQSEYVARALKRNTPEGHERIRTAMMAYVARQEQAAYHRWERAA
ncbi:hypothetical protein [Salipiger mucosus]|uniref:Uncharacterized protein n=1 Tax=Salipiger mucosus DSM 16094 TaxID=1123237 RepID=S9RVR6_9RHOB|nr:hypothetical protein [Salipiger mucosus]EPX82080.1 hypothetical protein Salmuc_02447 [Salipiger mucosus DSM 16094]